jgi:hypothetical protein
LDGFAREYPDSRIEVNDDTGGQYSSEWKNQISAYARWRKQNIFIHGVPQHFFGLL